MVDGGRALAMAVMGGSLVTMWRKKLASVQYNSVLRCVQYTSKYMYICACSGGECVLSGTCAHHCWSMLVSSARVVHVHVCTNASPSMCICILLQKLDVYNSQLLYIHVYGHDFNHP